MEGITEDIEGSIICNVNYLGCMMFLVKRVLWGNRASQVKPDQVKNILILKFGCHGHFTLFYRARKKLEFKLVLWASSSYLLLAWGHGHLLNVLRPMHIKA